MFSLELLFNGQLLFKWHAEVVEKHLPHLMMGSISSFTIVSKAQTVVNEATLLLFSHG